MLRRNPIEADTDAVMKTDMNYAYNRLIMKQRAVTNHLHFPFDDDEMSHCSSHTKNGDNTRQIKEEAETFHYKVGYGCRTPAWYIINNNHQQLPTSDELQSEDYTGNKYDIGQSMNENVVQIRDDDEEQFADDPRKGARTFNNSWIYYGSYILFREQIYQDGYGIENISDDLDID